MHKFDFVHGCFVVACVQIQIQKCSLDRNVTSATYKLVFSDVLHVYIQNNKVTKVTMNNNDQKEQQLTTMQS